MTLNLHNNLSRWTATIASAYAATQDSNQWEKSDSGAQDRYSRMLFSVLVDCK